MKEVIEWKEWAKEKPEKGGVWYLVYGYRIKDGEQEFFVDKAILSHHRVSWVDGKIVVLFWAPLPKGPSAAQ